MTRVSNLDERVRESLRQKIITGELGGGYHLSELKISKEYSVSRTPVREALCALAADGLIEMVPHRGAFVCDVPVQTKQEQTTAYGYFMSLAARLATTNASIEYMMELENQISFFTEEKTQGTESFVSNVNAINAILRNAASNASVNEAISMVERRMNLDAQLAENYKNKKEIQQQYAVLLNAMKRKKADAVEKTMRQIMTLSYGHSSAAAADGAMNLASQETASASQAVAN